jgi:hypothetical protein
MTNHRHSRGHLGGRFLLIYNDQTCTLEYQANAATKIPVRFSNLNDDFSKRKQEVSTRLGSAQGCAVRAGALRSHWAG